MMMEWSWCLILFCLIVFSFCNRCLEFVTQAPKTQFDASATAEPCKILPDQSATAEMVNWTPPDVSLIKRKIISIRSECCSSLTKWSPEKVLYEWIRGGCRGWMSKACGPGLGSAQKIQTARLLTGVRTTTASRHDLSQLGGICN